MGKRAINAKLKSREQIAIEKALADARTYAKKLAEQTGTKFIVAKPAPKKKKRAA